MASQQAPDTAPPTQPAKKTNFLKGIFGLSGSSHANAGGLPMNAPAPIKTKPTRQDSLPELVGTPSDIGVWEVSHDLRGEGGKFSWKRLFQDPRTYRTDTQSPSAPKT